MGFLSGLLETAVKVVVSPIAVVNDISNTLEGEKIDSTKNHVKSTVKSLAKSLEDLADGDIV